MSHQEKQEIFDQYARLKGFGNWIKLKVHHDNRSEDYDEHIFSACDLVQVEQQKRIAEKFKSLVYSDQVDDLFIGDFEKMEASIINPENLIK